MKSISNEYWGDNPRFFIGKVRRNDDPKGMGRVQVRIFGVHDNLEIEDNDLPWAQCLIPTTSPGISGQGENSVLAKGAMVHGMFLDGKLSQIPLIFGSYVTIQEPSYIQASDPTLISPLVDAGGVTSSRTNNTYSAGQAQSVQPNAAEIEAIAKAMPGNGEEEKIFTSLSNFMEPAQVCGFMGNIRAESGPGRGKDFNGIYTVNRVSKRQQYQSIYEGQNVSFKSGPWSEIVNPDDVGLPAFGLCQWRGQRWENLIKFSENVGLPWQSLDAQCRFIWHECTDSGPHNEKKAWGYINACGADVPNATYSVCRFYERPSNKFVRYGSEFGACPYTSQGTSQNSAGRRYWSPTLRTRIKHALVYHRKFVSGT